MNPDNISMVTTTGACPASLATHSKGEGPAFVWGHGLLANMAGDAEGGVLDWHQLEDAYQVIRYDARGHGLSECQGEPEDFGWDSQAGDLWAICDHYGLQSVVLGGASMGSATSLHAACQQPDRVRGLVLVIPPTAWEARDPRRSGYRNMSRIVRWTRGLPFKLAKYAKPAPREQGFRKYQQSILMRSLAQADYRGISGAMAGAEITDLPAYEQLATLQMPALILAWPDDEVHPLSTAEKLAELLPNASLQVADDDDAPWQWPDTVKNFLDSLE